MYAKKIIKRFVLYFLIPAILIVAGLLQLNKSVYTGELKFTRNLNPVTIKRDEFGIPTIEAKTFKDASYGLGFAHCQDRLWSIYFRRLLFAGRLSEVFGELTLSLDKLMRSLSLERYARYTLDHLDPDTIEHLQAYVDGFNDARSSMKILPLEFWMSWITIEKIQVVDMVTAVKGISYFLTFGHVSELIYSRLEEVLGPEKVRELIPSEPQNFMWNNVTILNDDELKQMGIFEAFNKSKVLTSPTGQEFPQERRAPRSPSIITLLEGDGEKFVDNNDVKQEASKPAPAAAAPFEKAGQIGGSNAWVIHGNHTTTGKPIIANDPHLTNAMPSFWYNAAMITEEGYLSGVSIPGCPYIIIGKSKDMAWGFTANMMDTADLYNITVRGEMYYYEGHWFPLQKYEEKIGIRGKGKALIYPVYETHHGVLIDNYFMEYYGKKAYKIRENERFAFAWMGYTSDDTTVESFKRLPFIKTADEMVANWKGATQLYMNIHFATQTGDIGFILLGRIPIRKTTSHGVKPLDGSKKENNWLGWIPWEDQPRVINPKKGYIVSANNKIATDNVKWHSMYRSFSTARAVRIEEMVSDFVKNNKKISVEDVKKMQLDVLDVCARDAVPIIVKCARKYLSSGYQPSLIQASQINTMLEEFDRWDYRMEKESIAASLLAVWEIMFKHKTLETLTSIGFDEDTRKTFLNETLYENFIFMKINSWSNLETANFDEYWCHTFENQGKPSPCLYNLVKALEETWVHLEKLAGKEFSGWQWQRIHSDDYTHTPFSNTMLRRFFHRAAPSSGNGRTVKVSTMPKGGLTGQWTPNMRAILSLEGQDHSYAVIDTGISGSPQSQHYDDQMKLHQEGNYIKMQEKKLEQWKEKLEIVFGREKKEETGNTGNSERKEGEL